MPADYDWKMLKDLARRALANLGWVEIALAPYDQTSGIGSIKIRRRDEADNLFGGFTSIWSV